jgi:putative ABC transport system permease protein
LANGVSPEQIEQKIQAFYDASSLKETRGPREYKFSLIPLDDIHLKSDFRFELRESSSKINIGLFVLISFVILLVSLLNFTNLTIAKLIKRSKELGLKKSIGANQNQLIWQILSEVFLFCIFSIFVALAFIELAKPFINQFFEIEFKVFYSEPIFLLSLLLVLLSSLGLTAIFVIFFLLGKNSTIDILSERSNFSGNSILKTLLIVQLSVVIILLSGTFLVNKQIDYVLNRPLGFNKENVVVLNVKDFSKDPAIFAAELEKQSEVVSVGMTAQHFGYPAQELPLSGLGIEGSAEFVLPISIT